MHLLESLLRNVTITGVSTNTHKVHLRQTVLLVDRTQRRDVRVIIFAAWSALEILGPL